jgi:hypothetical protein
MVINDPGSYPTLSYLWVEANRTINASMSVYDKV